MPSILRPAMVVLMSVVVAACSTPSPSTSPWAASPTGEPVPAAATPGPSPSTTGSSPTANAKPAPDPTDPPIADEPPPLALETIAGGLDAPINITATSTGWLLVNERRGRVVAVHPERGEVTVSLDITDRVLGEGERGLLGLALHPDWPAEPRAFVHYSDRDGDTVLSEFRDTSADDEAPAFDPASERVLLQVDQPYANHNGGQLTFGPDRLLYLGLGDGGSGGDPHGHGQNPATLLGSILRINPDAAGDTGAVPYGIPDDNPFTDGDGGAPEVFVYGLRNPWRFSFDRATGELWIADVGQNAYEEVDRLDPSADAGANLGWSVMEASHCFTDPACSSDGFVMPVAEYGRDVGCSVTGGHVYRGTSIRDLRGWYVFGDYCSGLVLGIRSDVDELTAPRVLLESGVTISTFGEGADGELYLADLNSGTIYRLASGG